MSRSAHADLPLHHGRVPPWLATRMARLSRPIIEAILLEHGRPEVLRRLSDPLWFQSFGAVLGMDWHSSGITTSVVGALKRALNPAAHELGLYVCGGRGRHSRNTPRELLSVADRTGLDGQALVRSSRLTAKVDNTAVQDGFQLYLHSFIVSVDGEWAVVQQGLNDASGYARRYHWHSRQFADYLYEPHTAVCGERQGLILNLTHAEADATKKAVLDFSRQHPVRAIEELRKIRMPAHHDVKAKDVDLRRLGSIIALAQESDLHGFEDLLLLQGVGPRTVQSLALVSEVIYGTPSRFEDPARYSFAHGGKDGKPFPVPLKVYDQTIAQLQTAVERARIGDKDKQEAIRNLHEKARRIEADFIPNDQFEALIEKEWRDSRRFGGRTVMDDARDNRRRRPPEQQLKLF